jgi:hypothetical protein
MVAAAMSGYTTNSEEIAKLTREIEKLKAADLDKSRRLALIEMFLDSDRRDRVGVTVDQIRQMWGRDRPPVPEQGPV